MSDTKTPTATATETAFDLTPPDPVPEVKPEKAAGLVPVSDEVKSKLQTKVDGFVADLNAEDANSPEFGKKVDQLTNMGRKEIMAAAGMSNRFLDRPVRAMDKDEGVGANLSELRRDCRYVGEAVNGPHHVEALCNLVHFERPALMPLPIAASKGKRRRTQHGFGRRRKKSAGCSPN